jgi:hypothetical protein
MRSVYRSGQLADRTHVLVDQRPVALGERIDNNHNSLQISGWLEGYGTPNNNGMFVYTDNAKALVFRQRG